GIVAAVADLRFTGPEVIAIHDVYAAGQPRHQCLIDSDVRLPLHRACAGEDQGKAATLQAGNVFQHDGGAEGDDAVLAGSPQLTAACRAELDGGLAAEVDIAAFGQGGGNAAIAYLQCRGEVP